MKKVLIIAMTLILALTAFAACAPAEKSATTYGVANGGPTKADITIDGKGKVLSATLNEANGLLDITDSNSKAGDEDIVKVEVEEWGQKSTKRYFKTIKVGTTTFTFDADKKDYVTASTTFADWIKNEANIKNYMEALEGGNVAVILNGAEDKSIYTKESVYKRHNGYWMTDNGSNWIKYADGTAKYVLENGFDNVGTLKQGDDKVWTDSNGISTGATWSGMPDYILLLEKAFFAASKG